MIIYEKEFESYPGKEKQDDTSM